MSEERHSVPVLDLQLAGWERRGGPFRRVLMTRDEFLKENRKLGERSSLVKKLLTSRSGLTNRQRRKLHREYKHLSWWLREMPFQVLVDNPSWGNKRDLRLVKIWSGERRDKAHEKKLQWLARKKREPLFELAYWSDDEKERWRARNQGKAQQGAC